ncbi:MAG: transcriptional regulator [Gallionellales bacterium RBG_16_56_9]|nr:MAG: transcriptional regulator [Gallionellales bacterium RBG_16_56_9]
MLEILGGRQKELLKLLLKNKSGMTADELSAQLGITRNAVRQHLAALETDRLVEKAETRPSGGRPQQLYVLTEKGHECFPRQYSWFAQLLVESVLQDSGTQGLGERLGAMGARVGAQLRAQYPELKTREEKVSKLSEIMQEIGYSTHAPESAKGAPVIDADNCVFHHLAMKNPDICQFDLALAASFTDSTIEHQECMARNDNTCRFRFEPKHRE